MKRCTEIERNGKTICPSCGKEKRIGLNRMCGTQPRQDPTNCQHRSETHRLEECKSCSGMVKIKVFECAKHGECTISKQIAGVQTCSTCPDFALITTNEK